MITTITVYGCVRSEFSKCGQWHEFTSGISTRDLVLSVNRAVSYEFYYGFYALDHVGHQYQPSAGGTCLKCQGYLLWAHVMSLAHKLGE